MISGFFIIIYIYCKNMWEYIRCSGSNFIYQNHKLKTLYYCSITIYKTLIRVDILKEIKFDMLCIVYTPCLPFIRQKKVHYIFKESYDALLNDFTSQLIRRECHATESVNQICLDGDSIHDYRLA